MNIWASSKFCYAYLRSIIVSMLARGIILSLIIFIAWCSLNTLHVFGSRVGSENTTDSKQAIVASVLSGYCGEVLTYDNVDAIAVRVVYEMEGK